MTTYAKINLDDLGDNKICYNEIDFMQHAQLLELVENMDDLKIIAKYNKYALLLRSGLIYESVRYLQTINPEYAVREMPNIQYGIVNNTVGNIHLYKRFKETWPNSLGEPGIALITVVNFMAMVDGFDRAKPNLINLDVIAIFSDIISEFCDAILNDVSANTVEKLPCFNMQLDRFLTGSIAIYSVGQYLIEKEFPTKAQYWKTLRLEIYNAIYNIDERYRARPETNQNGKGTTMCYNSVDDSMHGIDSSCVAGDINDVIDTTYELTKGYLMTFSYPPGELSNLYGAIIGQVNNIISKMKNEISIYTDVDFNEPQSSDKPDIEIMSKEALPKMVEHFAEVHGIISELYRVVSKVEEAGKDTEDFATSIKENKPEYIKIFNTITNLAIYLPILRLTISLIFGRVSEVTKQEV